MLQDCSDRLTLGPLWCGRASAGYSGRTLVDVLWRLVWATLDPLSWMCCGRAVTLVEVLLCGRAY